MMSNEEKFEAFKEKLIEENEQKYGEEIRQKYGENVVSKSNEKFRNMSKEDYERFVQLGDEILELLAKAYEIGDPTSPLHKSLPRNINSGSLSLGHLIQKKLTGDLRKCMSLMNALKLIMTKKLRGVQNF